jgi:hypothetical protein
MLILLNHAGPLEGTMDYNYDLQGIPPKSNNNYESNTINSNINNKNSVSLKKCISPNYNNNTGTLNTINGNTFTNNNAYPSLPSPEELNDINFVKEQNMSLNKEKQDIEEFYKNILLKLNEDDKRREEEMRLQVINMNSHLKYLEQKNKKLENLNYALNSKYMDLKYDFDLNNEKISKEIENNKNKNNLLLKGISDSRKKAKLENDLNQKEYNKRSRQVASTLRNQIKTNKETGILANKQLNEIQKIYEEKLNLFKNKYDMAEAKYNLLKENKYNNENLVIRNELERRIISLRERMKQHEEYIVKIKQMVEGDYDHYDKIKDITQNKNRIFFDDLKETENQIQQLVDIIPLNEEMEEYEYEEDEQNDDEINN